MTKNLTYSKQKKAFISFLAIISLISSFVLPQEAQAKSTGLLAFLTSVAAPAQAAEEPVFPESEGRSPVKTINAVVTAYNSVPGQTDSTPCITANGFDLCKQYTEEGFGNTIAANGIPMGTHVRFPELFGDKVFVVRDRMNARYGYGRIDVWLPDLADAKLFGVKRVKMELF